MMCSGDRLQDQWLLTVDNHCNIGHSTNHGIIPEHERLSKEGLKTGEHFTSYWNQSIR